MELLRAIDVEQPTRRARRRSSLLLGAGVLAAALIAVVVMQVQERGPPSLRHAASSIQHEAPRRSFLHALTAYYAADDDGAVRALDEVLQMAPDEPLAIIMRGRFRVGSHGGQEVDALLEHARRLVEGDQGAVPDLVRLLHRTPVTDEGWDTLAFEMAAYAERYPSFYLGRMLLVAAVVYGRPRQAAEEAFALEQLDPAPARTYLVQAQGWLQSDRPDDAEAALRRGLERHPSAQRLWIELAEVLTAQNDLARAEEVLRGILDQRPENVAARVRLARVLLARGDDEGWRRENDKLMSGTVGLSSVSDVAVTHATLLAARGRADEGNDLLARAIGYIERADDLHGLARLLFWQGLLAHRLEKDDVTTAVVKRIEGILPKASMSEPARRNAVVGINTLGSLVALSSRSIEEATAGVADLDKLAAQELFPKSAVRSHQMRLASRRGDVPEVGRLLREHMEERRSREKDTLYSTMLSQWLLTTAHGLAGDERQHEAGLREILEQREPCENEHEPHEQLCRIFLVKASVTLAELHVAKGRLSEARAFVDDVKALWPRADEGLPLMQRLRGVEARLDAP